MSGGQGKECSVCPIVDIFPCSSCTLLIYVWQSASIIGPCTRMYICAGQAVGSCLVIIAHLLGATRTRSLQPGGSF